MSPSYVKKKSVYKFDRIKHAGWSKRIYHMTDFKNAAAGLLLIFEKSQ